jgi:hypothetical protein
MMNKKYSLVLIALFATFIVANSLKAQVKNSVYSMFGVGQISDNSYGINKSLGGTGIAFQSGSSMNYLNPASYLGILPNSFNMELGAYGIISRSENKKTAQTVGDIKVSYFSASLYIKNWWALCFGLVPFSLVDYEVNSSDEIGGELTSFEKNYKGTGGLNRIYIGNSFRIYKGLAVGFNASTTFGVITLTETTASNDRFTGYELKNKRTASNFYLDYGLQYSMSHNDWLYTIGLTYGGSKRLNTTDELDFTYEGTTSFLEQDEQLDIKIPKKVGIGISAKKGNHFRAGFDYEWKNWSTINFSNPNLDTKNSNRFSIGVEYSPYQNKNSSLLQSLFYRFGANYKNSYLELDNTPINSIGVNFGIGIPYNQANIINFSIEYGKEGTLSKGLIRNNYLVFYLNFSLHEFWGKSKF